MKTTSHYTHQREVQLIESARAGETDGLVEYLYELLRERAIHLVASFNRYSSRLDADDVRHEGVLRVLVVLDRALDSDHVVSYLLRSANGHMFNYCLEQHSAIRVPHSTQNATGVRSPWVDSLDAPLPGMDDLTLLDTLAEVA